MFIGHLPAGYLLSCAIARRVHPADAERVLAFGLAGSVLPDLDLIWCYVVDGARVHHHRYFTHWPSFWLLAALAVPLLLVLLRQRVYVLPALALCANAFVHLLLDTLVGDIWWFAPWIDQSYHLFTVTAVYKPWYLNFLLHWSFALELVLVILALSAWMGRRTPASHDGTREFRAPGKAAPAHRKAR